MSRIVKLINKFKNNPTSISFSELEKILLHFNFVRIEAKGSHVKFKNINFGLDIVIPVHNNKCKNFYKSQVYKLLIEKI
jgi:predicted RNA binding protein YcfA (HicA-like mRNA interferase family)